MKFIIAILIASLPLFAQAQQGDTQLAYTYYQNKEYDKAAELFLKLYERTRSSNFLDYHIVSLINGQHYDKAEETLKKLIKEDNGNKEFLINLGYVYLQQGKPKKADDCFQKAIDKLAPASSDIIRLAYRFRDIREYEWAVKTYEKGRILVKQPDAFISELGDCYMMERNYEKMFDLFIQALEKDPSSVDAITAKLSFARSYDIINSVDTVLDRKLAQIFKTSDYNPVFDELAVWYALQKKDFESALQHAVKLNAKSPDKLHTFYNIAQNASRSGRYDIARRTYGKILEKGKDNNPYYTLAEKEILNCKYQEYNQRQSKPEQYAALAKECAAYLQQYTYNYANADIAILLSDIYAYRLALPDSADQILQRAEKVKLVNNNVLYTVKSKRADLLTYMDNPWEATILYTQIEKANPNNDIGYEAKLKKAQLAYYSGDLLWAKAQFDVLKGATTKLISNDAIKMSHFINMNYEKDGDNSGLEKLAATEYRIYKKQYQAALPVLDSLIGNSSPEIADYTSLLKAKVLTQEFKHQEAAEILEKLKNESEQIYIQAEAIYELAALKVKMKEKEQALALYKQLVSEYSGSVYSVEGGRLYRELEKN